MKQVSKLSFRPLTCLLLSVLLIGTGCLYGQQDGNSPEAWWRKAFFLFKAAKELQAEGDLLAARNKAREAKTLYDAVANNYPDFQPGMIKYKQRVVAEAYAKIREDYRNQLLSTTKQPSPQQQSLLHNQPQPIRAGTHPLSQRSDFTAVPNDRAPLLNKNPGHGVPVGPSVKPQYGTIPGTGSSFALPTPSTQRNNYSDFLKESEQIQRQKGSEIAYWRKKNHEKEAEIARKNREIAERTREIERLRNDPNSSTENGRILAKAMQLVRELAAQNDQLRTQLIAAHKQIKSQNDQIEKLTKERDDLARIVEGKGLGSEQLRNLIKENKRLSERLVYIQQIAERTAQDNQRKDQDIANLKYEINKIRAERDKLVQENVRHQVTIENLHKKLKNLSDGLDSEESLASLAPEEQAENSLLRSMIVKQLRRQAQQKHAKELVLQQLAQVGAHSTVLLEAVEDMARGAQLTHEEKSLFRSPQIANLFEEVNSSEQYELLTAPANPTTFKRNRDGQKSRIELSQIEKSARLDFQEGRLDEAENGFLTFLHYQPQNIACLCNLAVLKMELNNHSEAQSYLKRAVAIDSQSGLAHYLLGRSYFLQNNIDEAYSFMERSIHLNPKNDKALNCIGVIASQKGWISRAKRAFTSAISINSKNADAHFNLAVLHTSQAEQDPAKVKFHYFKALDIYKVEQHANGIEDAVIRNPAIEQFLKQNPVKGS